MPVRPDNDALESHNLGLAAVRFRHRERAGESGWLRPAPIEKDGPGRPPLRWLINPLLWGAENAENAENSHCRREVTTAEPEGRFSAVSAVSASTQEISGDEEGGGGGEESTWTV